MTNLLANIKDIKNLDIFGLIYYLYSLVVVLLSPFFMICAPIGAIGMSACGILMGLVKGDMLPRAVAGFLLGFVMMLFLISECLNVVTFGKIKCENIDELKDNLQDVFFNGIDVLNFLDILSGIGDLIDAFFDWLINLFFPITNTN